MFPAMLPLFPDLALAGASFRAAPERTRSGRATARHMGFAGAKIPVETTDGYVRATMLLTFRRRPTNQRHHHQGRAWPDGGQFEWEELETGGCVALALENMYLATGDLGWLRKAAPAIVAIAEFFASRMTVCTKNQRLFCLNNAMGPDESHAPGAHDRLQRDLSRFVFTPLALCVPSQQLGVHVGHRGREHRGGRPRAAAARHAA